MKSRRVNNAKPTWRCEMASGEEGCDLQVDQCIMLSWLVAHSALVTFSGPGLGPHFL